MQYTYLVKLSQHPEYPTYLNALATYQRCQQSMAAWESSSDPIVVEKYALRWRYADIQNFVSDLAHLFDEYNRVLWDEFPYCQRCIGGCCRLNATQVCHFDFLALIASQHQMPALNDDLYATGSDCIYLTSDGCVWPAEWRTLKCWIFYCLGGGAWNLSDSFDERYSQITLRLQGVVNQYLPEQLKNYHVISGDVLVDYLSDPLDFGQVFGQALFDILVSPLDDKFPFIGDNSLDCLGDNRESYFQGISRSSMLEGEIFTFIAEVVDLLNEPSISIPVGLDVSIDQIMLDIETLEWILLEHPENGLDRLRDIQIRYAPPPAPRDEELASISFRMRHHLQRLVENWS